MTQKILIGCLLFLAACNNSDPKRPPADTVTVSSENIDNIVNKAIEDSGVQGDEPLSLEEFTNQRPASSGLWNYLPFQLRLRELLGEDFSSFKEGMSEATELKKDKVFYSWGVYPDDAVKGFSYIIIDPETYEMMAYRKIGNDEKTWKTPEANMTLPEEVERKKAQFR